MFRGKLIQKGRNALGSGGAEAILFAEIQVIAEPLPVKIQIGLRNPGKDEFVPIKSGEITGQSKHGEVIQFEMKTSLRGVIQLGKRSIRHAFCQISCAKKRESGVIRKNCSITC